MYRVVTEKDLRGEIVCVYQTEKTKNNSFRLSISNAKGWRPKTASYISNPVCFGGLNVGSRLKIRFYSTRGRSIDCFRLEDCKEELFCAFLPASPKAKAGLGVQSLRPSVRPSVCPSVRPKILSSQLL